MGFSRLEYWSGLPFSPPGDLPDPGVEPEFPVLADGFSTTGDTWGARKYTAKTYFIRSFRARRLMKKLASR